MALYNEILVGRFNRFLQKHLGMKGRAPAPQLSSDIQAGIQIASGVENMYLQGWNLFALNDSFTALAANQNGWRLRNPPTSGVVAVIEGLGIAQLSAAAQQYNIYFSFEPNDLSTVTALPVTRRDSRGSNGISINTGSALVFSRQQAAAISSPANPVMSFQLPNQVQQQQITYDDQQWVLMPGLALQVVGAVGLNAGSGVNLLWRERFLEESERT